MFSNIQKLIGTMYNIKQGGYKDGLFSVTVKRKINFKLVINFYSFKTGKTRGLGRAVEQMPNQGRVNPLGDSCQIFL
jgi:hypothetical protein